MPRDTYTIYLIRISQGMRKFKLSPCAVLYRYKTIDVNAVFRLP